MTLRLGLSGPIVPASPAAVDDELALRLAGLGARVIVTHFQVAHADVSDREAGRVRNVLARHGLSIVQSAGLDLVLLDASPSTLAAEERRLAEACRVAGAMGAEMLLSGTGSFDPEFRYGGHPDNFRPATVELLVRNLRRLVGVLEAYAMPLALEGHVLTTLSDPETCARIVDAVGSPLVRMNLDPVNYLASAAAVYESGPALRAVWAALGPVAAGAVHLKDVDIRRGLVLHIDEVPPGEGHLDFATFFELCQALPGTPAVIVEHLPAELVPAALAFVRIAARNAGVSWA